MSRQVVGAGTEPLAWVGLAMGVGAASWPLWRPEPPGLLAVGAALAILAALLRASPWAHGLWLGSALLLGAASVASLPVAPAPAEEERVRGEVVAVSGSEVVLRNPAGEQVLRVGEDPPAVGDRISAWTVAALPAARLPGAWDQGAADRLARRPLRKVKRWVRLGPPPPEPAFADARHQGMLLALATGRRDLLPDEERRLLQRTGTTHLLSISGLHVALVASVAGALAALLAAPASFGPWPRLPRLASGAAALAAACAYAAAVGWPVSATRAVWMVGAAVAARVAGRGQDAWSALGLAATAVLLLDPSQVFEPAALLSFGAVAGILWVGPRVTRWLPPDAPWIARYLVGAFATTLGATMGTLPVSAWLFQDLPPLAPLANLVAVPLVGAVATPAALLAIALPGGAGALALWVADHAVGLALLALGPLDVSPLHPAVGPMGALLLALALPLRRQPAAMGGLLLLALGLHEVPRGGLTVTWLSVGQGDAALLRWPDGRAWLVDGGPPSRAVLAWLRREGVTRLEAVFLSHPDLDHLGGLLPVLEALPVGGVWVPRPARPDEAVYASLLGGLAARGVPVHGPAQAPPPGATLLLPPARSDNDGGLVLLVRHGERSLLFTGDVEAGAEAWLVGRIGPVDVVKVPHHGSRSSSTPAFVAATRPALAVVSVGAGNPFGHPAPEVLARWPRLLRTDQDGTIELWTDGRLVGVRAWSPGRGWSEHQPLVTERADEEPELSAVPSQAVDIPARGG